MLYESLLLFGVVFIAGWLFDTLTQSRSALTLRHVRQLVLFLVLAAYFVYFWRRGGQTLAMKTWHVRLVRPGLSQIPLWRAALRYVLAWMWFVPAMALAWSLGWTGWPVVLLIVAGAMLWAATMLLDRDRQFLHDRLAGTRLIVFVTPPSPKKKTK